MSERRTGDTRTSTAANGQQAHTPPAEAERGQHVPLYATQPPAGAYAGVGRSGQPGEHGAPSYVHVPSDARARPDLVVKPTGPSPATVVLAVVLLCVGGIAGAVAWGFPWGIFPVWGWDPKLMTAVALAVFGALLLVVAIAWSVASAVHAIVKRRGGEAGASGAEGAPQPASGERRDTADRTDRRGRTDAHRSDLADTEAVPNAEVVPDTVVAPDTGVMGNTGAMPDTEVIPTTEVVPDDETPTETIGRPDPPSSVG